MKLFIVALIFASIAITFLTKSVAIFVIAGLGITVGVILWTQFVDKKAKEKYSPPPRKKRVVDPYAPQYVYVIMNPAFRPGIFKVGMTTVSIMDRIKQLFTTGVPVPFATVLKFQVDNGKEYEKALHVKFADKRINRRREFFQLTEEDVLEMALLPECQEQDPEALRRALSKEMDLTWTLPQVKRKEA
jgi:hypothetical protein